MPYHAKGRSASSELQGRLMKDMKMNPMGKARSGAAEEGLGSNSDIGAKLRALYGAVQDEGIPSHLLDLLEKLDQAEQASSRNNPAKSE